MIYHFTQCSSLYRPRHLRFIGSVPLCRSRRTSHAGLIRKAASWRHCLVIATRIKYMDGALGLHLVWSFSRLGGGCILWRYYLYPGFIIGRHLKVGKFDIAALYQRDLQSFRLFPFNLDSLIGRSKRVGCGQCACLVTPYKESGLFAGRSPRNCTVHFPAYNAPRMPRGKDDLLIERQSHMKRRYGCPCRAWPRCSFGPLYFLPTVPLHAGGHRRACVTGSKTLAVCARVQLCHYHVLRCSIIICWSQLILAARYAALFSAVDLLARTNLTIS